MLRLIDADRDWEGARGRALGGEDVGCLGMLRVLAQVVGGSQRCRGSWRDLGLAVGV